jgi:hypothetical protein
VLHAELLDPNSVNEIHGIEVSKNTNEIYLVGQYISSNLTVDAQTLTNTTNAQNSFIIKMDTSFIAVWAKKCNTYLRINQTVGSSVSCLKRIEMDKLDNIYVTANGNGDSTVIGSLSFNHRISPNGNYAQDIYIAKLNGNGQEIWLRNGGSDGMDVVTDLATDEWGNSIISVYSSQQSVSGLIFGADTIQQWYGGLVKYDPNGNLLYTQKLQEARTLQALAMSLDSTFYGTGNGKITIQPFLNLSISDCEDSLNGYNNPPFQMVMVKFFDNTGNFTTSVNNLAYEDYNIDVFPNPAGQIININFKDNSNNTKHLVVFDLLGNEYTSFTGQSNTTLNVENLPTGIYFLKVNEGNSMKVIKFMKQ